MSWQVVIALVVAIPVVLLPVAFVWFLNTGGIVAVLRSAMARRFSKAGKVEAGDGK